MKWNRINKTLFATVGIMATGVGILYRVLAIILVGVFFFGKIGG
jgi:hypothetical protein